MSFEEFRKNIGKRELIIGTVTLLTVLFLIAVSISVYNRVRSKRIIVRRGDLLDSNVPAQCYDHF